MWHQLIELDSDSEQSLQMQLRAELTRAIVEGSLQPDVPLPSSRELASQLSISRNTVVLAYHRLIDEGYLVSRERQGYFINDTQLEDLPNRRSGPTCLEKDDFPDWDEKVRIEFSGHRNIHKPSDWSTFKYPFVYGQPDPTVFPVADWRECLRQSERVHLIGEESFDYVDQDDETLVEQLRTRVLPRRGIWTSPENILITLGTQNALALTARLLLDPQSTVAIENPGYPDVRNLFQIQTPNVKLCDVDDCGLVVDESLRECDLIYVTPSHQSPTMATMPQPRREALVELAVENDIVIIEDDYEPEANYVDKPQPALKSIDTTGHVIYCGSLSKTLAPGLRLGYLVADQQFIKHARMLRRLHMRHPPPLMQNTVALFLQLGHYDSHIRRMHQVYRKRWELMGEALEKFLPGSTHISEFGGSAYWICGPSSLNARKLTEVCARHGIIIEPGDVHFGHDDPPLNFFRLGFSSIANERIEPGIEKIASLMNELCTDQSIDG